MGLHKKILIGLHRKHRSLHLCVVQVGVHREKTGYTAMEKEVVRPATFANVRVCKITILLSYSARCGCITVAHAQIEHTTRSMVLCHNLQPTVLCDAARQRNAALRGPVCCIQNSHD